jgi:uncharacterized repeat protein (TIGR01451 family)
MWGSRRQWKPAAVALMLCALVLSGCATCRVPRIDPSGERFFLWDEVPAAPLTPVAAPAVAPNAAAAGPVVYAPAPVAAAPAAAAGPVAVAPVYRNVPGAQAVGGGVQLTLHPLATVAPVGSEVVVLAGVLGPDQYLRTNQRIEWMLDPAGVGFFVDFNRRTLTDWLVLDANRPQKINNTYAIGSTSRQNLRLTRGTPQPDDDVLVLSGQAWISVTSAVEGTSYVAAMSPCVYGWENRKQVAVIHWVDAQWSFPPPAINPAGSRQTLTTTVTRQSDQSPCPGWVVRYEIVDGPPAGFAPNGAPAVEVPTDSTGQACAEIIQTQPAPGTNRVNIQVIRPANADGGRGRTLTIGSGSTLMTWSAPGLTVRKRGPSVAAVGSTITYQIEVSNPGDLPAEEVAVVDTIPQGLTLVSSNPSAQAVGGSLQWQLGRLGPTETRRLEVNYRVERQGNLNSCAEVTARGGLKSRDCVTTNVSATAVDVRVVGPDQAAVGSTETFEIEITNRSPLPISGLVIKDRFDPGLKHAEAESPIERDLGMTLAPGQSQRIGVELQVVRPGRHCQTVEIRDSRGTVLASARQCITAVASASPPAAQPTPQPSPQPKPQPAPQPANPSPTPPATLPRSTPSPALTFPRSTPPAVPPAAKLPPSVGTAKLNVTAPLRASVGETVTFSIEVTNTGLEPLRDVELAARLDEKLDPSLATSGNRWEGDSLVWTLAPLPPGETIKYQIQARAVLASREACLATTLRSERRTLAQERTCVQVYPAPGSGATAGASAPGLTLTVESSQDQVNAGRELTYNIEVFNGGATADTNIVVLVNVPSEMTPVRLQTTGPTNYVIEGQTVRFSPVAQLAPNGHLNYRVRVLAKQEGVAFFQAQVSSQGLTQPIVKQKKTTITPR